MKTIFNLKLILIKLFTILFLLLSIIVTVQRVNAQSIDDLLYSEWSLQESNVNGVSISLENSGLPTFYSPNNEIFFLHYYGVSCFESFKVNYTDVTESSFNLSTIFDYVSCIYTDPEEIEAVELYQSFYFELPFDTNSTPRNPFTYEWVDAAPFADELRITNNQGDWLLYRTNSLSTPIFKQSSFIIHPNPTKNALNIINSDTTIGDVYFSIHDILGKLVEFEKNISSESNISLNVSHLKSGLYFLTISNKNGNKQTLKFVKQ